MNLQQDLLQLMRENVATNPRPEGMSPETYAAIIFAAQLVGALKRAEDEQWSKLATYAARQATVDANTGYHLVNHYEGLAVLVREGDEKAFASWLGIKLGDLKKTLAGEEQSDWIPNTALPPVGRQLAKPFRTEATWLKQFGPIRKDGNHIPEQPYRPAKAVIFVDWKARTHAETLAYANEQRRQGPVTAVTAAPEWR
jgi:hypothetical protein